MFRMRGLNVEPFENLGMHAFALHLGEQGQQAVGQAEDPRSGLETGQPPGEPVHQTGQFQLAAQRGHRRGQPGHRQPGQIRNQLDPRQKAGAKAVEFLTDAPAHPPGVEDQPHPGHRLGRLILHPVDQTPHKLPGEIDAGRQGEDMRISGRHRTKALRRARCIRVGQHHTSRRDAPRHRHAPRRGSGSKAD